MVCKWFQCVKENKGWKIQSGVGSMWWTRYLRRCDGQAGAQEQKWNPQSTLKWTLHHGEWPLYIGVFDVLSHFRNADRCGSKHNYLKSCDFNWKSTGFDPAENAPVPWRVSGFDPSLRKMITQTFGQEKSLRYGFQSEWVCVDGSRQSIGAYYLTQPWTKRPAKITCSYERVLTKKETSQQQSECAVQEDDHWR